MCLGLKYLRSELKIFANTLSWPTAFLNYSCNIPIIWYSESAKRKTAPLLFHEMTQWDSDKKNALWTRYQLLNGNGKRLKWSFAKDKDSNFKKNESIWFSALLLEEATVQSQNNSWEHSSPSISRRRRRSPRRSITLSSSAGDSRPGTPGPSPDPPPRDGFSALSGRPPIRQQLTTRGRPYSAPGKTPHSRWSGGFNLGARAAWDSELYWVEYALSKIWWSKLSSCNNVLEKILG